MTAPLPPEFWTFAGIVSTSIGGIISAVVLRNQSQNRKEAETKAADDAMMAVSTPDLQWRTLHSAMESITVQGKYIDEMKHRILAQEARIGALEEDQGRMLRSLRRAAAFIERLVFADRLTSDEKRQAEEILDTWVDE